MPKVVITLPAYRAEHTLARTIAEIPSGVADRLILVDDASPDNTAQVARELGVEVHVHRENLGYGGNQKTCYIEALASGADIIVLLHPDYQYEPKAVPLLIAPILAGDADMTFGSRFAGLGDPIGGGMPLYRYVGNRITTIAENLMLGSRFSELHSGLRAYTRRCLLSLPILRYSNDFLFDSQLLIDAVTTGQRVVEVPIPTRYTKESSSIAVDRSLRYIAGTLRYCARTAILRGRRGRRARSSRLGPPAVIDAVSVRVGRSRGEASRVGDAPDAEAVLDVLDAYYVPSNRLLVLRHDQNGVAKGLARERGWATLDANTPGQHEYASARRPSERRDTAIADAIVLRDDDASLPDALAELERAKSLLHPEGLLVVATRTGSSPGGGLDFETRSVLTRDSVRALLTRAGFDVVEWIASPRHRLVGAFRRTASGGEVVVARPAQRAR